MVEVKFSPLFYTSKGKVEVKSNADLYESMSKRAKEIKVSPNDSYSKYSEERDCHITVHRSIFHGTKGSVEVKNEKYISKGGVEIKSKTGDIDENSYLKV